ncbi:MAG: fimbria major subunit, partial [Mucinivorans sp.]
LYQAKYNKPATTLEQLFTAYTDGLCYFRVDLWNTATSTDKNKSWGVLRNHIYSVNIKSIKGPGRPAFPIDPNTPLDEESWIQVTVDVEPWVFNDLGDVDLQ